MLRNTFGLMRKDVTGHWRKLHNGTSQFALVTQYYSEHHIEEMRWAGHVACMGEKSNAGRVLVEN